MHHTQHLHHQRSCCRPPALPNAAAAPRHRAAALRRCGASARDGASPSGPLGLAAELSAVMANLSEAQLAQAAAAAIAAAEDLQQQQPAAEQAAALRRKQEQQQQQHQQQQDSSPVPPSAAAFLQHVLQQAAQRYGGHSAADLEAFMRTPEGKQLVLDTARAQFTASEAQLLDLAFGGPSWPLFGIGSGSSSSQFDASTLLKLSALEPEDMTRLGAVMDKLRVMTMQMDVLAAQSGVGTQQSKQQQQQQQQPRKARAWGSSLLRGARAATAAGGKPAARSLPGQETGWSSQQQQQQQRDYSWAAPLQPGRASIAERLQRLLVLTDRTLLAQQTQWGVPPSQQFQMLCRLYHQLVSLAAADYQQQQQQQELPGGAAQPLLRGVPRLDEQQLAAGVAAVNAELNWLVQQVADEDTATRSAFWFMQAVLDPSWVEQQQQQQQQLGEEEEHQDPQQQQQPAAQQRVSQLEQLGTFLAAAANLEGLRAWCGALAGQRPHLVGTPELQQVASLLDDDWFVAPAHRADALAAAQAAAAAGAQAEALAAALQLQHQHQQQEVARAAAPPAAFGLQPHMIDSARIQQLAGIEGSLLWLLAELEASPEPGATLTSKWALHPTLGPRVAQALDSGDGRAQDAWLQALVPEVLRGVYTRSRVADVLAQV